MQLPCSLYPHCLYSCRHFSGWSLSALLRTQQKRRSIRKGLARPRSVVYETCLFFPVFSKFPRQNRQLSHAGRAWPSGRSHRQRARAVGIVRDRGVRPYQRRSMTPAHRSTNLWSSIAASGPLFLLAGELVQRGKQDRINRQGSHRAGGARNRWLHSMYSASSTAAGPEAASQFNCIETIVHPAFRRTGGRAKQDEVWALVAGGTNGPLVCVGGAACASGMLLDQFRRSQHQTITVGRHAVLPKNYEGSRLCAPSTACRSVQRICTRDVWT